MNIETFLKASHLHNNIHNQELMLSEMKSLISELQESPTTMFAEFNVRGIGIMISPEFVDQILDTVIRLQSDYIVALKAEFYQL